MSWQREHAARGVGRRSSLWQPLAVAAALVGANAPIVAHYLGGPAVLVYLLFSVLLWVGACALLPTTFELRPILLVGVALSLGVQLALLQGVAPRLDARMDRDDALSMWIEALGRGDYPYAIPTGRGNPISVLPGMHLLAAPFYLLGNVGYLPVAAYVCLVLLLWLTYRRAQRWRAFSLGVLSTAPLLFFEVTGRSDFVANLALLALVLLLVERRSGRPWGRAAWLLGALLGWLAATRLALVPVLALVGIFLGRSLAARDGIRVALGALAAFGVLVVPFATWQPDTFFRYAPLGVNSTKLGRDRGMALAWLLVTFVATLIAATWVSRPRRLFVAAAGLMALVMAATWLAFSRDLTYLQMVFVPLLFALPRGEPQGRGVAGDDDARSAPA